MFYCEVKKDTIIFNQNDKASAYFIICTNKLNIISFSESGEIEIIIDKMLKKVLTVGNGFGELALLSN